MKKAGLSLVTLLALALLCVTLAGCQSAGYEARFDLRVTEAVIEENPPETGPDLEELVLSFRWSVTSAGLDAHVTNPRDTTAAILWEAATFSYGPGEPEPLVATAPKAGPDLPQPPTVIPAHGQMVVGMLPRSHAEWVWSANRAMGGSWKVSERLFGVALDPEAGEADRLAAAEAAVGRSLTVEIPVGIGERVLNHIFEIRVTGAEVYASYH